MNSVGFFGKVFCGLVAVILTVSLGAYFSAIPIVEQGLEEEARASVERDVQRAHDLCLQAFDPASKELDVARLFEWTRIVPTTRLTVVTREGTAIFDSHKEARLMGDLSRRPELLDPGKFETRFSETLQEEMTFLAMRVEWEGQFVGYARVASALSDKDLRMQGIRRAIQSGGLIAALVSLGIAWFFARRVTRPMNEIGELIAEIGNKGTDRRLRLGRSDELGRLALAVNNMADRLQSQVARVERDRKEREAIFSALAAGLLAVDVDQNVLFINQQARELLGGIDGIVMGKPLWELTRNAALIGVVESCLETSKRAAGETRMSGQDGEYVVELTAVPLAGEGGEVRSCVLEIGDVSELRRLEAMRRDFVSNVSHELKTPLTAMRGYTEAILEDEDMPKDLQRSFLEKANKNTTRLVSIVSDLLSLSRLESTGHELEFDEVDLQPLAEGVAEDLFDLAESRQKVVHVEAPEEPVVARADAQALGMALSNLVSNAIYYSPAGEDVRVVIREAQGEVSLEVHDSGPGIPQHERERVFERFYRLDKARSRKLGGTGLGLAIVRHVMSAHEGRVELESEIGRGSCFRLVLPGI